MKAAIWMLGALVSFCIMAVGAREISGDIDTFQILYIRSIIGLAVISFFIYKFCPHALFATQRYKLHIFRNIFHFAGQYGWFLGLGFLPLAEVFALEFTVPIWTVLISAFFLKETLNSKKIIAVILGVIGVYIILKPDSEIISYYALIVLGAAFCYSISHVSTKVLSSTEHTLSVVFYMCLIQLPISFIFTFSKWVSPSTSQWLWLFIIAITALTAHYCLTQAMKFAEAGVVVTLDFLRLPLIAVVGVLIYSEPFSFTLLMGGILMLSGNLVNLYKPVATPISP